MSYIPVYSRINWENEPSINTPINATNLNAIDYAVYTHDQTLVNWDTTKANESDLLLCVKEITYDSDTGEFLFTWQNGTTLAVDLNIEKIPVSFSMSPQGVITMTTEDGSTYTADVGSLIKTYSFADSSVIDFTVTTDASGNKTVTADIVDGSITGQKLQPNYLADCVSAKTDAETAEGLAEDSAEDSEAWANGTRNGVPVPNTDPTYHNNSKYWSEQSNPTSLVGLTDTDIDSPTNGQTLIYNSTSQKWENQNGGSASLAGLSDVDLTTPTDGQVLTYDLTNQEWVNADIGASGGSKITVKTNESFLYGLNVTITDNVTYMTETFSSSGVAVFEGVTMVGNLTISSQQYSATLNVPYYGSYSTVLSGFNATITVTFPADSTCTCSLSGGNVQTAYVSPHTFTVHGSGTYTITATDGVHTKSTTVVITSSGQSESVTLSYVPDGATVTPTDDIQTWLACGGITDKSYTTLSEVLADSTTLSALIADNNAVDYMVRSKSWASNKGLVPNMTSDTTPSGVASASNFNSGKNPYLAFDGDNNSYTCYFTSGGDTEWWLEYEFDNDVEVGEYTYTLTSAASSVTSYTIDIQCYIGNEWVTLDTQTPYIPSSGTNVTVNDTFTSVKGKKFRLRTTTKSTYSPLIMVLQFSSGNGITEDSTAMSYIGLNNYCANTLLADSEWLNAICNSTYFESVLNTKVPVMTSDNTPSGECICSSVLSGYPAYYAFDGNANTEWASASGSYQNQYIGYDFGRGIKIYKITIKNTPQSEAGNNFPFNNFKLQGYDTQWNDIQSYTNPSGTGVETSFVTLNSSSDYTKYCVNGTAYGTTLVSVASLQFYGRVDV